MVKIYLLVLVDSYKNKGGGVSPFRALARRVSSLATAPSAARTVTTMRRRPVIPTATSRDFTSFFCGFTDSRGLRLSHVIFPLPCCAVRGGRRVRGRR